MIANRYPSPPKLERYGGSARPSDWCNSAGNGWAVDRVAWSAADVSDPWLDDLKRVIPATQAVHMPDICHFAAMGPPPDDISQALVMWHMFRECSRSPSGDTMLRMTDGAWVLAFYEFGDGAGGSDGDGLYLAGGFNLATRPTFRGFRRGIALTFNPQNARHLFGISAHDVAERRLDATEVWQPWGSELLERLRNATSPADMLTQVFAVIRRALRRPVSPVLKSVNRACRHIVGLSGNVCIKTVAQDVAVSTRTLERWFSEHVGLSPKVYARVRRQWAVSHAALAQSKVIWIDVALSLGYADQAHLIREFKEAHGFSPTAFRSLARGRGVILGPYAYLPIDLPARG